MIRPQTASLGPISDVCELTAALSRGGSVLVLGGADTGKTTLIRDLVSKAGWNRIALLDTDLGQGSVGPPGTIGAALLGPDGRSQPLGSVFVGAINPIGHSRRICEESARLLAIARDAGPDAVLIDTCGLVRGRAGCHLKTRLIETLSPDVIIALAHGDEVEPILSAWDGTPADERAGKPSIRRVCPSPAVSCKTSSFRRRFRESRFAEALSGAVPGRVAIDSMDPRNREAIARLDTMGAHSAAVEGRLVGLLDHYGLCLAIGIVDHLYREPLAVGVWTALTSLEDVRAIGFGSLILDRHGRTVADCPPRAAMQAPKRWPFLYCHGVD